MVYIAMCVLLMEGKWLTVYTVLEVFHDLTQSP